MTIEQKAKEKANDWFENFEFEEKEICGHLITSGPSSTKCFEEGYIAGAIENGIQWHDLRKDPNDLPKECEWYEVSVYSVLDGNKKKDLYTQRAFYDSDLKEWETDKFGFCERDNWINNMIRAWCEIPTFKE